MIDIAAFKPRTVYVTYIAAAPGKVWQALTKPEFSKQYFFGFAVDIEPRAGGRFRLLWPDGRLGLAFLSARCGLSSRFGNGNRSP